MKRTAALRFCFIVEEQYRNSQLPRAVVDRLAQLGHNSTILEPASAVVAVNDLAATREFDAIVLRTVSNGPGLSLLHALGASGVTTINNVNAIRRVRDKAVVAATARAYGIPFPDTYLVTKTALLEQLPVQQFPLVVKPNSGGFGRGVRLVPGPGEIALLDANGHGGPFMAQTWVPNPGHDIKLYNTGRRIFAVRRRSSLAGGADHERELIPVTRELRDLAKLIGVAFRLDIYGADVIESTNGPVVVDVNDFPSFKAIPEAPRMLAGAIVDIARRGHVAAAR
jgi:ribosomal protein S6--L-glutamate ligase